MWRPELGCRIELLPDWVQSQQAAELWALTHGVRLASHIDLKAVHTAIDNLEAIWSAIRLTGVVGIPIRARLHRRLSHMNRRTRRRVFISWVPSKSNPADAPSRLHEYCDPIIMQAEAWATFLVASGKPNADLAMALSGTPS